MTTSWSNTRTIDQYLDGSLRGMNRMLFEVRLLVHPALRRELYFQKKTYSLVKLYHRKKQKEELETLHRQIFSDPHKIDFRIKILNLFN